MQSYADVWPATIRDNQLRARGNGLLGRSPSRSIAPAAATAAPARSPAATPDGKRGCKTAGRGSASRVRSALHTPDGRSKKIRNRRLGADPRTAGFGHAHEVSGPAGVGGLGLGRPPALGAATAVPPALGLAFLLAVGRLPILPAGLPSPPPPRRRAALGATVPGLGVGGSKELLAPLEQTPSLSRPTSPLTGPRFAASWMWAQGSGELPTAKPRTRSPYAPLRGDF